MVLVNYLSLVWVKKLLLQSNNELGNSSIALKLGSYCKEGFKNTFCLDAELKNTSNSELDGTNLLSIRSEFLESGKAKAMVMSALDHPMISSELSKALGGLQASKGYKELMASLALSLAYTKVLGEFSIRMNKFAVKEDSNFRD